MASQIERSKIFTQNWTVTIPSNPSLKFFRATPSHFDVWLPMISNPINNELQDTANKVWDEAAILEWKEQARSRFEAANINLSSLEILVESNGEVVGYGDVFQVRPGVGSVGIVLNKAARGKGIGKTGMQVFIQLGLELGMEIGAGTMKANGPMRGVMKSLGVEGVDKIIEIEGRGRVAEISYTVDRKKWNDVDIMIEFEGPM